MIAILQPEIHHDNRGFEIKGLLSCYERHARSGARALGRRKPLQDRKSTRETGWKT
jgi:hypothetical protein